MKKEITLGDLIAVVSVLIIPLAMWGISLEKRDSEYKQRFSILEKTVERVTNTTEQRLDKIDDNLTKILVELQNKKDREK